MRFRRFRLRKQRDEDLTAGLLMRSPPASGIHIRVTGSLSPASVRGFGPLGGRRPGFRNPLGRVVAMSEKSTVIRFLLHRSPD